MSERPVVLSASSVGTYQSCHLAWFFTYILNEPGEQSEAQRVGIAVHDYAERMLQGLAKVRDGGHPRPVPAPTGLADLARVFDEEILPTYRDPVLIEAEFQIEVNDIPFSGIIDSVDRHDVGLADAPDGIYIGPIQHDPALCKPGRCPGPTGCWCAACERGEHPPLRYANILRDLKTTGSRPKAGRYRFPMIGYWLGARELGSEPAIMQLDYIVRTQHPYYWPEVVAAPTDDDIAWFAATLHEADRAIRSGDYAPTGLGTRACASCGHRAICGPYQRYKEVTDA
jgi:hypothetical protein